MMDFPVIGVGVTAFQRTGLAFVLPKFEILALLTSSDLPAIRKMVPVTTLEEDLGSKLPEKYNTSSILEDSKAKEWLKQKRSETDKLGLFVYKASKNIDKLAAELGLTLMSTPGEIRQVFENKKSFRVEAEKAGVRIPRGATLKIADLTEEKWLELQGKLGEKLVFQLTDYSVGGGMGTFFVNNKQDFDKFGDFVTKRGENRDLVWVNVAEYMAGKVASMTGVATKHGVVTGKLQTQIIDQPELAALSGRSGVWLGHDWNIEFSQEEQQLAEEQVKKWGEYIYRKGYKGLFGLDVVVTEGEVVAIECNARYTGAFPAYTMMQVRQKETPLDKWHMLEWLGEDYQMDIDRIQSESRQPKNGAQLLLHNLEKQFVVATKQVKSGVYNFKGEWLREGFSLTQLENDEEFILADRVPSAFSILKPADRLGRLLFSRQIVDNNGNLLPETKAVIKVIYDQFELAAIARPEGY